MRVPRFLITALLGLSSISGFLADDPEVFDDYFDDQIKLVDISQDSALRSCLSDGSTADETKAAYDKCFGKNYDFNDLASAGGDTDGDGLPDDFSGNEACFYEEMGWVSENNEMDKTKIMADMEGLEQGTKDSFDQDVKECMAWSGNFGEARMKRSIGEANGVEEGLSYEDVPAIMGRDGRALGWVKSLVRSRRSPGNGNGKGKGKDNKPRKGGKKGNSKRNGRTKKGDKKGNRRNKCKGKGCRKKKRSSNKKCGKKGKGCNKKGKKKGSGGRRNRKKGKNGVKKSKKKGNGKSKRGGKKGGNRRSRPKKGSKKGKKKGKGNKSGRRGKKGQKCGKNGKKCKGKRSKVKKGKSGKGKGKGKGKNKDKVQERTSGNALPEPIYNKLWCVDLAVEQALEKCVEDKIKN